MKSQILGRPSNSLSPNWETMLRKAIIDPFLANTNLGSSGAGGASIVSKNYLLIYFITNTCLNYFLFIS